MSGGKRGSGPEGAFSLFLSFLGLKKRRQHTWVYTLFFSSFISQKKKKSEANMLNVSICKTWVTCEGILLDPFLYFSLYLKIFDDCS